MKEDLKKIREQKMKAKLDQINGKSIAKPLLETLNVGKNVDPSHGKNKNYLNKAKINEGEKLSNLSPNEKEIESWKQVEKDDRFIVSIINPHLWTAKEIVSLLSFAMAWAKNTKQDSDVFEVVESDYDFYIKRWPTEYPSITIEKKENLIRKISKKPMVLPQGQDLSVVQHPIHDETIEEKSVATSTTTFAEPSEPEQKNKKRVGVRKNAKKKQ